jgi:hypothetical protein
MADVFACLNAQSRAFSAEEVGTADVAGCLGNLSTEGALVEGSARHTADTDNDSDRWPQLGQDISFAVPDVLERSGDFGTKPLKSLVSSGLWKMDTADMRTLELDMAKCEQDSPPMDRRAIDQDKSQDA